MILEKLRSMYHKVHQRIKIASEDAIAGKEWTKDNHIKWRIDNILPVFNEVELM